MLLCILLDLNIKAWEMVNDQDPLNNLRVFINAFLLSKYDNIVKIINSVEVLYDSRIHDNFDIILKHIDISKEQKITPKDLGYALMENPDEVLIFEMSNEEPSEYLEYLKCMFVAQNKEIKINGFSNRCNMLVKMVVEGSGGKYLNSCSLKEMLGLLGLPSKKSETYEISCTCCNKYINLAMVCPICLAIYCKFIPVCKRCKTKFSFIKPT